MKSPPAAPLFFRSVRRAAFFRRRSASASASRGEPPSSAAVRAGGSATGRASECIRMSLAGLCSAMFAAAAGFSDLAAVPVDGGLIVHLDASDVITIVEEPDPNGLPVTSWNDKSGRDLDAVQDIGIYMPTLVAGATPAGGSVVRFDGEVMQYLDILDEDAFEADEFTWYIVFRPHSLNAGRMVNSGYWDIDPDPDVTTANGFLWGSFSSGSDLYRVHTRDWDGAFAEARITGEVTAQNFFIGGGRWRNAGDGEIAAVLVDSAGNRFSIEETGGNAVPRDHMVTRIGAAAHHSGPQDGPRNGYDGDIAEIVVYDRSLSEQEQLDVEAYLYQRHFSGVEASLAVTEGLLLWLDASDVTTVDPDGDPVESISQWNDQTGRQNHAYEPLHTGAIRPTLAREVTPTGGDAIAFKGLADEFLDIISNPADLDGPEFTAYVVFNPLALDNGRVFSTAWADIDPGSAMYTHYSVWGMMPASNGRLRSYGRAVEGNLIEGVMTNVVTADQFMIGGSIWDSNSGQITGIAIDQNGVRNSATTAGITALPSIHLFTRIGSGSATGSDIPNNPFSGYIAEILIYNRILGAAEQEQVEQYLFEKHFGGLAGYAGWRAANFNSADAANPAVSGPFADPVGDGVTNLLRYAFNIPPLLIAPIGELPSALMEEGKLRLSYNRLKSASDLAYLVEISNDLIDWETEDAVTEINIADQGAVERVTVEATGLPGDASRGFMRLRVEIIQ